MNDAIMIFLTSMVFVFGRLIYPGDSQALFSDTTLVLGFLIVIAYFSGRLAARFHLPRITGYILMGVLCGPWVLKFVTQTHLKELILIDEIALGLIAFTAGAELNIGRLKKRVVSISAIIGFQVMITFLLVTVIFLFSQPYIRTLAGEPFNVMLAISLIIGIIAVAKSPAQTIAVIVETRAKGMMTDTILGVTVAKDIVVIVLFTVVLNFASSLSMNTALDFANILPLLLEILASLVIGAMFGGIIIFYLKNIKRELLVFIITLVFFITSVSHQFHLEFILTCMTAGFVVENFSRYGHRFLEAVERSSLPVYLIFFSIAGANLNLKILRSLWQVAVFIVLLRLFSVYLGTYTGARIARDDFNIRHLSWAGFIGQAGVSLGLAVLAERQMGEVGVIIKNIVVSTIMINSIIGPVMFKWALGRANEIPQVTEKMVP